MRAVIYLIISIAMNITLLNANNINIQKGWNLFSTGKNSEVNTSCLLNKLSSHNPIIWSFNNSAKSWINENNTKGIIKNHNGFWLETNSSINDFNITTCQISTSDSNITLYSGWNLISMGDTVSIDTLMPNFINPTLLWQYNNQNKSWLAYSNDDTIKAKINNNNIPYISSIDATEAFWSYNYSDTYTLNPLSNEANITLSTTGGVPEVVAYTPKYKLIISPVSNDGFLVGSTKNYYFKVTNYDGTLLDTLKINSIVIESLDSDKLLFDDNSKLKVYTGSAYAQFALKGLNVGDANIKITADIKDDNGSELQVNGTKKITILSKEEMFDTNYNLTDNINGNSISANETKTFFYQIKDKNGNQVDDSKVTSVTVKTLDESKIAFDDGSNKKEFAQKAYQTFNLKANDTTATAKLQITANMSDGSVKTVDVNINITPITVLQATKIIFDPDSFIVEQGKTKEITIHTYDTNNIPISTTLHISQLIDSSDKIYGSLDKYTVTTDSNGKATLTYTPPSDISTFGGTTKYIVFSIKDSNITKNLQLKFPAIDKVDKVILSIDKINVTDGLKQLITVYTLNSNNKPISATLDISAPYSQTLGKMLGSFSDTSITTNDKGEGSFYYNAPNPFDSTLKTEENVTISDELTGKNAILTLLFSPITVETNATNYEISLNAGNSFEVDNKNSLIVDIVESDNNSIKIDPKNIFSVSLTSLNHLLSFSKDNDHNYSATYKDNYHIDVYTGKIAGLDILDINASIFDGEKNTTISKKVPVTISSGPAHSISIIYLNSAYDDTKGLYEDSYTIHAVDKFGNPAKEGTRIYAGVVNGLDKNGSNDTYIYGDANGIIYNDFDLNETDFNVSTTFVLDNVQDSDTLVVLANEDRVDSRYLGGWSIKEINNNQLILQSIYSGNQTDKLTFVIGNEKRYNKYDYSIALADIDSIDKTYTIDENGTATLKLRYGPYMVGKNVFIYANSQSDQRVGIAIQRLLSGTGIKSTTYTCSGGDSGKTCDVKLTITMNDRDEPVRYVTVGGFVYDGCSLVSIDRTGTLRDGVVELHVNAPANKSCDVTWDHSIISEYTRY